MTLPPQHMTPLERLVEDRTAAFRARHHYELEAWASRVQREIKAMGEARRRGVGQQTRFAIARLNRGDSQ